jgi:hypothetical protein
MPVCSAPSLATLTLLLLAATSTADAASNAQLIATPLVASSVGRWQMAGFGSPTRGPADQFRLGHIQRPPQRPKPLVPLYLSFAALQVLDAHSTIRALDRGYVEANPLVAGSSRNRGTLVAMKAAVTASVIVGTERLWRHNRIAAIAAIAAVNGAYAVIVSHNYRNATR